MEKVIASGEYGWVLVGLGCHPRVGLGRFYMSSFSEWECILEVGVGWMES